MVPAFLICGEPTIEDTTDNALAYSSIISLYCSSDNVVKAPILITSPFFSIYLNSFKCEISIIVSGLYLPSFKPTIISVPPAINIVDSVFSFKHANNSPLVLEENIL